MVDFAGRAVGTGFAESLLIIRAFRGAAAASPVGFAAAGPEFDGFAAGKLAPVSVGTSMTSEQDGQRILFPATASGTLSVFLQWGH